jgi:hypothetical protein
MPTTQPRHRSIEPRMPREIVPPKPKPAIVGLDEKVRSWDMVFPRVPGAHLVDYKRVAYVVRRTWPGTDAPHEDIARFNLAPGAPMYEQALECAHRSRAEYKGSWAVIDAVYIHEGREVRVEG